MTSNPFKSKLKALLAKGFIFSCTIFPMMPLLSDNTSPSDELYFSFDRENVFPLEKVNGTARWISNEKYNGAYKFDGKKDFLEIKDNPELRFGAGESFTIQLSLKTLNDNNPNKTDNWSAYPVILSKKDEKTGNWWVFHVYTKNRIGFKCGTKSKTFINLLIPKSTTDDWRDITLERDAKEDMIRLYRGNDLLYEKELLGKSDLFDINGPLMIGTDNAKTKMFEGLIDEIKIYRGIKKDSIGANETVYKPGIAKTETPDKDIAASWTEIDKHGLTIVPCPKSFKVTGNPLALDDKWEIVSKSPGIEAGIETINEKLTDPGKTPLKIVKNSSGNRIIAGNYDNMSEYLAKIGGPQKPQRQGYIIDFYKDGNNDICIIAGTDTDGTRYGCITLSEMIKSGKNTELVQAKVRDWPDYKFRMGFSIRGTNIDNIKNTIDTAFKAKMNMILGEGFYSTLEEMLKTAEARKTIQEYAGARGIRIVTGGRMNVGDAPYKSEGNYSIYYYPLKEEGLLGHRGRAYTWCRDDLLNKKADLISEFMKQTGADAFFFHAMDTGGRDNPENWSHRTPMDIKRWGNDRASADANLINIFYSKMKKENPDSIMVSIVYPYGGKYLKYQDIRDWLTKLSSLIPEDVFTCVREGKREDLKLWKDATRQGRFIYHEPFPCSFGLMCAPTGRYAATFFFDDKDAYWFVLGIKHAWPSILTAAEYAWNTKAPGWGWMQDDYRTIPGTDSFPPELTERLLPRITSILYGPKAAENMRKVYAQNLSYTVAGDMHQFTGSDPEAYFKAKYEASIKAMEWIKEIEKDIPPKSADVFNAAKSCVKSARYLLEARYRYFLSRKLLAAEKYEDAEKEITLAMTALSNLPDNDNSVKSVKADLDISTAIKWRRERKEYLKNIPEQKISIGLYSLGAYKGIEESFSGIPGITVSTFDDPTEKELKKFTVIIFPAARDIGDTTEDWAKNVRKFVEDGGGVIFSHNSIGRFPSSAFGKPLFPEICSGYDGQISNDKNIEITEQHPSTGNFAKGEKFEHEYTDHLFLKSGPQGAVIIKDAKGNPVMVAGKVGKGHVIYTGQIFGFNRKNEQRESTGKEWILLFNMTRWAAGQK